MKSQQKYRLDEIRKQSYEYHKHYDFSGYTGFKLRLYIEGAALITWVLQWTEVHPTVLTLLYGLLGVIGGILLSLKSKQCVYISLYIFYFKGILDSVDGHLARIKGKVSDLGRKLDIWTGFIGTLAFYMGLGVFIGHRTNYYVVPWLLCLCFIARKCFLIEIGRSRVMDTIIFSVGVYLLWLDKITFIV